jgi:hypothetical protein
MKEIPQDLVDEFDKRAEELKDEDYAKLEVDSIDVKSIQNTPSGVYGFWQKSMLVHPEISKLV